MTEVAIIETYSKNLGHGIDMAGEIALCPLRHALAAPADEGILWQRGVGVFDFEKGELYSAIAELVNQLAEVAVCGGSTRSVPLVPRAVPLPDHHHQCIFCVPPEPWTFSTLSLPAMSWKALASGAVTENTAHWP